VQLPAAPPHAVMVSGVSGRRWRAASPGSRR
jgi:hypothetical protein